MNQALKNAIREVERLPEAEQEEIAEALLVMAARKQIEAMLAAAEAQGGATPHDVFMAELRAEYADRN